MIQLLKEVKEGFIGIGIIEGINLVDIQNTTKFIGQTIIGILTIILLIYKIKKIKRENK